VELAPEGVTGRAAPSVSGVDPGQTGAGLLQLAGAGAQGLSRGGDTGGVAGHQLLGVVGLTELGHADPPDRAASAFMGGMWRDFLER
jgi:PPE-repeat protein